MNKSLVLAALFGAISAKQANDLKQFELILEGVFKGALDAEGFTDIEQCIQDVEGVVGDAEKAYTDFAKQTATGTLDGLKDVADLLKRAKDGMSDCSSLKADWEKLKKMAEIFESPATFAFKVGENIIVHGSEIYHEVSTAVTDYEQQKWFDFGEEIGMAGARVLLGEQNQYIFQEQEKNMVAKFVKGTLETFGGQFNLEALLMCIEQEDQAALVFYEAFKLFKEAVEQKDWQSAIGGVIAALAGVQAVQQGLPACEAVDMTGFNSAKWGQAMDVAYHPVQHMQVIEEDIFIHGVSIFKDVEATYKAFEGKDYEVAGQRLGDILKLVTKGDAVTETLAMQAPKPFNATQNMTIAGFTTGFFQGANIGTLSYTDMLLCLNKNEAVLDLFGSSMDLVEEAMTTKDGHKLVQGIVGTVGFVKGLENAMPTTCPELTSSTHFLVFDKIVDLLENWKHSIKYDTEGNKVWFNSRDITSLVSDGVVQSLQGGDHERYGQKLGATLAQVQLQSRWDLF